MTKIRNFQRGKNSEKKSERKNRREEIPLKESFDVTRKLMIFRHSRRQPPTELQQLCACACMCVCVLVCPYVRVVFNEQHSFSRTFPPTVSCFLTSFPCWNSTCHPRPLASVSRLIKFSFHLSRDFLCIVKPVLIYSPYHRNEGMMQYSAIPFTVGRYTRAFPQNARIKLKIVRHTNFKGILLFGGSSLSQVRMNGNSDWGWAEKSIT